MYGQEVIKPYGEGEKAQQVEQMFDHIAPSYDKLNHRLSWNIDKGWRRKAISQLLTFFSILSARSSSLVSLSKRSPTIFSNNSI